MERYKENIQDHFDDQSVEIRSKQGANTYGSATMPFLLRSPYAFIEEEILIDLESKIVLDLCCGTGIYAIYPAMMGANVEGVDISEKSISMAKERASNFDLSTKCKFTVGDVESLNYPKSYFDIVLIYGSLSYLEIEKTFDYLSRIIKPGGKLIVVDSLGHNFIFNLNRRKNLKNWAKTDIDRLSTIKKKDIYRAENFFSKLEVRGFDFFTAGMFYFNKVFNTDFKPKFFFTLDRLILRLPLFKWLAFKVVFVCSKDENA